MLWDAKSNQSLTQSKQSYGVRHRDRLFVIRRAIPPDDLIVVSGDGMTWRDRLYHPECAAEFPKKQTAWA
jgi:hypothetical protein